MCVCSCVHVSVYVHTYVGGGEQILISLKELSGPVSEDGDANGFEHGQ